MRTVKEHIQQLFKDIPASPKKEVIMREITENLEEKVLDLTAEGYSEQDAIQIALEDFGDIDEIQKELIERIPVKKNNAKYNLVYSVLGSLLIISLFLFINFYYSPNTIWFVYPTFVVLWWPLSMLYVWFRTK